MATVSLLSMLFHMAGHLTIHILSHLHETQSTSVVLNEVSDSTTDTDMSTQQYRCLCVSIPYAMLTTTTAGSVLITCLHVQSQERKDNGAKCHCIVDTSSQPVSVHMTCCQCHLPVTPVRSSHQHIQHKLVSAVADGPCDARPNQLAG